MIHPGRANLLFSLARLGNLISYPAWRAPFSKTLGTIVVYGTNPCQYNSKKTLVLKPKT